MTSTVRREKEGGELYSADIFRTKEVLQMRTSVLFGTKKLMISRIYSVSAPTRGRWFKSVRTFFKQRDQFFAILYGRLLWTTSFTAQ